MCMLSESQSRLSVYIYRDAVFTVAGEVGAGAEAVKVDLIQFLSHHET